MKYLLLFLLSLSFTFQSYAQTMTAYEKKCYSLNLQFLRNAGVSETIIKKIKSTNDLENVVKNLHYFTRREAKPLFVLAFALASELKGAEKLKTSVDFQRDKEKKENEKTERYNNSDYVHIKSAIKEDLIQWLQKGEFEKN